MYIINSIHSIQSRISRKKENCIYIVSTLKMPQGMWWQLVSSRHMPLLYIGIVGNWLELRQQRGCMLAVDREIIESSFSLHLLFASLFWRYSIDVFRETAKNVFAKMMKFPLPFNFLQQFAKSVHEKAHIFVCSWRRLPCSVTLVLNLGWAMLQHANGWFPHSIYNAFPLNSTQQRFLSLLLYDQLNVKFMYFSDAFVFSIWICSSQHLYEL